MSISNKSRYLMTWATSISSHAMLTLATIASFVYLGFCAALFIFQRSLIYFPQPRSFDLGIAMITLQADGAEVLVTTRPHSGSNASVYFGGNAADAYLLPR